MSYWNREMLRYSQVIRAFMSRFEMALLATLTWLVITLIAAHAMSTIRPDRSRAPETFNHDWTARLSYADPELEKVLIRSGLNADASTMLVKSPGFPFLLTKPLTVLTNWEIGFAQFVSNKLATLLAAISTSLLFTKLFDKQLADRAVGYLLFSLIGGYVFLMSYPEPFYIGLWVLGFYFYFRSAGTGQIIDLAFASLCFCLAVLSRPQAGPSLIPALFVGIVIQLVQTVRQRQVSQEEILWTTGIKLLLLCVIPAMVFWAWLAYTSQVSGVPLAPLTLQSYYFRSINFEFPLTTIIEGYQYFLGTGNFYWGIWYETLTLTFILISLAVMFVLCLRQRLPWEFFIFSLLTVIIALGSGTIRGMGRFSIATPVFLVPMLIVPRKFDMYLWMLGIALSLIAFMLIVSSNTSLFWQP